MGNGSECKRKEKTRLLRLEVRVSGLIIGLILFQEPMQEMVVGDQSMEVVEKGDSHISCGGSTERPSSLSGLQENRGKAFSLKR